MALIDVSELLQDPDLCDQLTLIRRTPSVNSYGEGALAEASSTITAAVQGPTPEQLGVLPSGVRISDHITVYYRGEFITEKSGAYADIVVWQGKRYQIMEILESFMNNGFGFTAAIFQLEDTIG